VGLVSKENRRRTLVVLFNFAQAQGWLRKNEETAADALGTYKIMQREVEIYTPAEIRLLLSTAEPDFLPYIALICFGGVRREELHRGFHGARSILIGGRSPSPRRSQNGEETQDRDV